MRAMNVESQDHQALVRWAADCAERVLPWFERPHPGDDRPRRAVEAARAWLRGELEVGAARTAASAAHEAAREAAEDPAASAAAHAAGHAAASAHMPAHAAHAANYAVSAVAHAAAREAAEVTASERDWQQLQLPEHLQATVKGPRRG
ncbi:putative immunity protein [Nannocystis sp. SCPEA4]|uniref:putative immunity protein n=1 Tax=Nannocystis sp. SCPEA4 TaxID=2996787 RepID=UPI00226FCF75|nr:hypothetical protein [Nannocystis sp. SCPEA4]MCY1054856.1 hypothetical protein [Nannocystis sp. SCPEA4]